jgi:hypothetical protein
VGNPRDTDIAKELVDYLIEINYFKSEEEFDRLLRNPFLKEKLINAEDYRERIRSTHIGSEIITPSKVRDAEFAKQYRDSVVKDIVDEERSKILEGIESSLFPSILDSGGAKEPAVETGKVESDSPWWQDLNLESDPFPGQEGLLEIPDKYVDSIVTRTTIFVKYLNYFYSSPTDVLKNTIFFGTFGQGKTTLFDYLRKVTISQAPFHPVYIQLAGEADPQALLAKFKVRLLSELSTLFELLAKRVPETYFPVYDPEPVPTQIYQVVKDIKGVSPECEGFLVFIDDLHKLEFGADRPGIFKSVLWLLSNLQVFRAEFIRKTGLKIAFYVAAIPDWEGRLRKSPPLSGSFTRYETMPAVSVEDAVAMINLRFAAFANNKQNPPRVDENLVGMVFRRNKEAGEAITWRTFIKSIVNDELQQKHFDALQASPLTIPREKKNAIQAVIESEPGLKVQINAILYGPMETAETRFECFKRLVDVSLKGGVKESALRGLSESERYYYERLLASGLIRKRIVAKEPTFIVSPEFLKVSDEIVSKFGFTLEDCLLVIYGSTQLRTPKGENIVVETAKLESLAERSTRPELRTLLRDAASNHTLVVSKLSQFNEPLDPKLVDIAIQAVATLTRAWAIVEKWEQPATLESVERFWTESWVLPGAVGEFFKAIEGDLRSDREIRYCLRMYELAFGGLVDRLSKLHDVSQLLFLSRDKLTRAEMEILDKVREQFLGTQYFQSMKECTELVENRLRRFLFNTLSLLYGGPQKRATRLDKNSLDAMEKNRRSQLDHVESNEFELLNRGQYKSLLVGPDPQGHRNWMEIFQHVFKPWDENTTRNFLDRFADTNVKTSHGVTSAFPQDEATEMFRYVSDCVTFLGSMNLAYRTLFRDCHLREARDTEPRNVHLFSFYGFKDKPELAPISIPHENLRRLLGEFSSKIGAQAIVDFSDWLYIKTVFNSDYRQFCAFFAQIWKSSRDNDPGVHVRVEVRPWFGSEARLDFSKV